MQVALLPVSGEQSAYAVKIGESLFEAGVRFEMLTPEDSLGKRIREGEMMKIPYLLVLGDREAGEGNVTVRNVLTKNQETLPASKFVESLLGDIRERKPVASIGC